MEMFLKCSFFIWFDSQLLIRCRRWYNYWATSVYITLNHKEQNSFLICVKQRPVLPSCAPPLYVSGIVTYSNISPLSYIDTRWTNVPPTNFKFHPWYSFWESNKHPRCLWTTAGRGTLTAMLILRDTWVLSVSVCGSFTDDLWK